jgi:hypothetical protein
MELGFLCHGFLSRLLVRGRREPLGVLVALLLFHDQLAQHAFQEVEFRIVRVARAIQRNRDIALDGAGILRYCG